MASATSRLMLTMIVAAPRTIRWLCIMVLDGQPLLAQTHETTSSRVKASMSSVFTSMLGFPGIFTMSTSVAGEVKSRSCEHLGHRKDSWRTEAN